MQLQRRANVKIAMNTTIDICNASCPLCADTITLVDRVTDASVHISIHDELIRSVLTTIPENAALCAGHAL